MPALNTAVFSRVMSMIHGNGAIPEQGVAIFGMVLNVLGQRDLLSIS